MGDRGIPLGEIVATPGAITTLTGAEINSSLARHQAGDWGLVCDEDKQANDDALKTDARLLSVYENKDGVNFWIITEWDRNVTTVLLPEDY